METEADAESYGQGCCPELAQGPAERIKSFIAFIGIKCLQNNLEE